MTYVDMLVGHVAVGLTEVFEQDAKKTDRGNEDERLLIEDVDLLGNQSRRNTGTSRQVTDLGGKRITGKLVEDRCLLGCL